MAKTSVLEKIKFGFFNRWEMFEIRPFDRLSTALTQCPRVRRASQRWLPMNPAPPATRIFIIPPKVSVSVFDYTI
jgi:hypothetical protein